MIFEIRIFLKRVIKFCENAKWVTNEVTKCRRLKNKALKRYVKLKTIESYDNYKEKLRKSVR